MYDPKIKIDQALSQTYIIYTNKQNNEKWKKKLDVKKKYIYI